MASLRRLSRNPKNVKTSLDEHILKQVKQLPGRLSKNLRFALHNVRSQLGQRDFMLKGLASSGQYLPSMEEIFKRNDLPTELTRIPFVESSFNVNAESRVGASGIWQIMPSTGRQYFIVNERIDERNSPLKATVVAAKVFKLYHKILGHWPLTVTAYNHGVGSMQKAIRKAKSRHLHKIIKRYHRGSFKFASSNFYSSFLAALHAEKYHREIFKEFDFDKLPLLHKEPVFIKKRIRLATLARKLNVTVKEIIKYNLDLRKSYGKRVYLPKGFKIFLPKAIKKKYAKVFGKSRSKQARADYLKQQQGT